jgi:hypothetical protein
MLPGRRAARAVTPGHKEAIMRVVSGGAACLSAVILGSSSVVGAAPLEREHYSFETTDTFTDTECGEPITIDYAAEFSGVFMLKKGRAGDPTPYVFDNYSGVETYTNTANGKTATLLHQGLFKDVRIEHVSGTVYQITAIETGRPVVAIGPDGKKLITDRGRIRYTFFVDTQGDTDLSNDVFLGELEPEVAGPHPVFFGVADFCDLLAVVR